MKYEYYLEYWGEVCNEEWIRRDLGISERNFWFDTAEERAAFRQRLLNVALAHRVIIAFAEYEGTHVRLRTVARMRFRLPDGTEKPYDHDFGFGYPDDAAEYAWLSGNFSCDCNRADLLGLGDDVPCGCTIELISFEIYHVPAAGALH